MRSVNLDSAAIFNESRFPKAIHVEAHLEAGRSEQRAGHERHNSASWAFIGRENSGIEGQRGCCIHRFWLRDRPLISISFAPNWLLNCAILLTFRAQ